MKEIATDLIDRQSSMKAICDGCFKSRAVDPELKCRGTCNVIDILQQQPKAESRPELCGHWVVNDRNPDYADCTNCGLSEWLGANGSRAYAETLLPGFKKFCPNCGARMNGGSNDSPTTKDKPKLRGYWYIERKNPMSYGCTKCSNCHVAAALRGQAIAPNEYYCKNCGSENSINKELLFSEQE